MKDLPATARRQTWDSALAAAASDGETLVWPFTTFALRSKYCSEKDKAVFLVCTSAFPEQPKKNGAPSL